MVIFLDSMASVSKTGRFRLMLFLKLLLKCMAYNYFFFTILLSFNSVIFERILKSISIIKLFLKNQFLSLNINLYF